MIDENDELSLGEAAKLANRSSTAVRKWIKSGQLPARKEGGSEAGVRTPWVIRAGDLFVLLASKGINEPFVTVANLVPNHEETRNQARSEPVIEMVDRWRMEAELERVRLEANLERTSSELGSVREMLSRSDEELTRCRAELAQVRHQLDAERREWMGRTDKLMVELEAERVRARGPWWRRLLNG